MFLARKFEALEAGRKMPPIIQRLRAVCVKGSAYVDCEGKDPSPATILNARAPCLTKRSALMNAPRLEDSSILALVKTP